VVSTADPFSRNLGFLDRSHYFLFQLAPQFYSHIPDPLFVIKSGSAGNRTRTSGSVARNSDHKTIEARQYKTAKTMFKGSATVVMVYETEVVVLCSTLELLTSIIAFDSAF
jgi:hypothetical protein